MMPMHSHSHSDHYSGDDQFRGQPNVTVIGTNSAAIDEFLSFDKGPNQDASLELCA
jgi:hypothetical protein